MLFCTKKIHIALLSIALLTGCASYNSIRVTDVRSTRGIQATGAGKISINLDVKVDNPTWRNVQLKTLELTVFKNNAVFVSLAASEKITVPKHSDDYVAVPINIKLQNVVAALLSFQKNTSIDDFEVEGIIKVGAFPMGKTITIKRQSLASFSATYGDIVSPILNLKNK
jgi:LEA14-like dessication related protein